MSNHVSEDVPGSRMSEELLAEMIESTVSTRRVRLRNLHAWSMREILTVGGALNGAYAAIIELPGRGRGLLIVADGLPSYAELLIDGGFLEAKPLWPGYAARRGKPS